MAVVAKELRLTERGVRQPLSSAYAKIGTDAAGLAAALDPFPRSRVSPSAAGRTTYGPATGHSGRPGAALIRLVVVDRRGGTGERDTRPTTSGRDDLRRDRQGGLLGCAGAEIQSDR